MAERNADVPPDWRIEFRMGINVGDIIKDSRDIYGDGVNVAARLEALDGQGVGCWKRWRVGTSCCAGKKRVAGAFSNPAEQKKSHWTVPAPALPISPDATERQSAPTELTVAGDRKFESCSLRQGVRANFMSSP